MSKSYKIILFTAGGLAGLFVIIAGTLIFFVDVNVYKPRLEAAASETLGMEVGVGGRLRIGFLPGIHITLADVVIRNRGTDVAAAKEADLRIAFLPLIQKKIRIRKIALKHPKFFIERSVDGTFNFERVETGGKTVSSLDLTAVVFSNAALLYVDKQSGEELEADDFSLTLKNLRLSGGKSADFTKRLSFTAKAACGQIRKNDITISDLKISADGRNGLYAVNPITMRVFGARGSGSVQIDVSGEVPLYNVQYTLMQFDIEDFFKTLSPRKSAEGRMDFITNLSMRGKTVENLKQTLEGQFSLRGENLTLNGSDLDKVLSRFESSQNFNLVDVGAFFVAGPVGLVVTRGYNFASLFQGSEGHSEIRTLVSDWKVERGVALARDVAMATNENRIALQGELDFVNERFKDVIVALVDATGCATVRQKIHGAFQKPEVEKPSIFKTLTGPVYQLFKKGMDIIPGGECEVFYDGSVASPG